jgi:hypothetical protein
MSISSTHAVPPPTLSISPSTTEVYAGSFLTVNCSVQLSTAVDSPVAVTAVWRKNGVLLANSTSRMLSAAVLIDNSSLYLTQAAFRPVQLNTDDGLYACEATVEAEVDEFILDAGSRSNNISLLAAGIYTLMSRDLLQHASYHNRTITDSSDAARDWDST